MDFWNKMRRKHSSAIRVIQTHITDRQINLEQNVFIGKFFKGKIVSRPEHFGRIRGKESIERECSWCGCKEKQIYQDGRDVYLQIDHSGYNELYIQTF